MLLRRLLIEGLLKVYYFIIRCHVINVTSDHPDTVPHAGANVDGADVDFRPAHVHFGPI